MSHLDAISFQAENQPLEGEDDYNAAVVRLTAQIRAGEITLDQANVEALNALIDEVFPDHSQGDNSHESVEAAQPAAPGL